MCIKHDFMADQLAVDLVLSDSELKNISILPNTILMARREYYCNVESRMGFLESRAEENVFRHLQGVQVELV